MSLAVVSSVRRLNRQKSDRNKAAARNLDPLCFKMYRCARHDKAMQMDRNLGAVWGGAPFRGNRGRLDFPLTVGRRFPRQAGVKKNGRTRQPANEGEVTIR
jgi:hypothetical protein